MSNKTSKGLRDYFDLWLDEFSVCRSFKGFDELKGIMEMKVAYTRLACENEALKNEIAHLKLVISRFQTGGEG